MQVTVYTGLWISSSAYGRRARLRGSVLVTLFGVVWRGYAAVIVLPRRQREASRRGSGHISHPEFSSGGQIR